MGMLREKRTGWCCVGVRRPWCCVRYDMSGRTGQVGTRAFRTFVDAAPSSIFKLKATHEMVVKGHRDNTTNNEKRLELFCDEGFFNCCCCKDEWCLELRCGDTIALWIDILLPSSACSIKNILAAAPLVLCMRAAMMFVCARVSCLFKIPAD